VQRDELAVEDRARDRQRRDQLYHLGNAIGDVVQGPCQDADIVSLLVYLSPDAVQLPLDTGRPGPRQGIGEALGRAGQHGADALANSETEEIKCPRTIQQKALGNTG